MDATLGINNKMKKALNSKSPTISNKRSIISMNKKAVENISEMNRQMKKLKKSPPTNRKRKVEMDMPSPLTPLNLVMENNRFNQYTEIKQMPSRTMV